MSRTGETARHNSLLDIIKLYVNIKSHCKTRIIGHLSIVLASRYLLDLFDINTAARKIIGPCTDRDIHSLWQCQAHMHPRYGHTTSKEMARTNQTGLLYKAAWR